LIHALNKQSDVTDLTIVSNNCGVDDCGLGLLLRAKQVCVFSLFATKKISKNQ
jgi:acyl CoA:acetate/3-ketoacid CoA transferase alpha subunit